jgi:hypothetical protein
MSRRLPFLKERGIHLCGSTPALVNAVVRLIMPLSFVSSSYIAGTANRWCRWRITRHNTLAALAGLCP